MNRNSRTVIMVEVALTVAMSAVLHFVSIWQMPMGGSVSLDMLPIIVLAVRRGPAVGILAGALFGVVDYIIEPFFVTWVQIALDYPVAYGLVGLAGLAAPAWRRAIASGRTLDSMWAVAALACVIGVAARFAAHFTSGVIFFASNAPAGTPGWAYSVLYNGMYLVPAALLIFIPVVLLLPGLERAVPSR